MKTSTNKIVKTAAMVLCIGFLTTTKAQVNADLNLLNELAGATYNDDDSKNYTGNEKAIALDKAELKKSTAVNPLGVTANSNLVKPISFSAFPDDKDAGLIYLYSTQTCAMIEITDMEGNLVHTAPYENENQNNEPTYIDAPLTPGTYTISLRCDNQVVAKQLVIK